MLKQKITGSVQEVILPDFPDDDNTVTTTVTKSRRVSFGPNFVKEFIVDSAVTGQCMAEYEQPFPSSDSSNADSSHSAVGQSTFVVHENTKAHKSESGEERAKLPKFASTICFSADSPTADMEFTEGCITLAKSILDKKNKEMTVYIQAKPKDGEKTKEEDTNYFEGSQFEMSVTKCLKPKENNRPQEKRFISEKTRTFGKYEDEMSMTMCEKLFMEESDSSWEESKENRMPLDAIMRHLDKDSSDSDLFNPEKSFGKLFGENPFELSAESENLNLNESMDISGEAVKKDASEKSANELSNFQPSFNKTDVLLPEESDMKSSTLEAAENSPSFIQEIAKDTTIEEAMDISMEAQQEKELVTAEISNSNDIMDGSTVASQSIELENFPDEEADVFPGEKSKMFSSDKIDLLSEERVETCAAEKIDACPGDQNEVIATERIDIVPGNQSGVLSEEQIDILPGEKNDVLPVERIDVFPGDQSEGLTEEKLEVFLSEQNEVLPVEAEEKIDVLPGHENEGSPVGKVDVIPRGETEVFPPEGIDVISGERNEVLLVDKSVVLPGEQNEGLPVETDDVLPGEKSEVLAGKVADILLEDQNEVLPVEKVDALPGENSEVVAEKPVDLFLGNQNAMLPEEKFGDDPDKITSSFPNEEFEEVEKSIENNITMSEYSENPCEKSTLLADLKVVESLTEQSKESGCVWSLKELRHPKKEAEGLLSFCCQLLESTMSVDFILKMSEEDSFDSCSVVTDSRIQLDEEKRWRLPEYIVALGFGFEQVNKYFEERRQHVSTVRHVSYFLDEVNSFLSKTNGFLRQIHSVLTSYPGSSLKDSKLSFRLFSFPIFFSCMVSINLGNIFRLSRAALSFEHHFGCLDERKVGDIFEECLKRENSLCEFIVLSTRYLVELEKPLGLVSKREHIRLLPEELQS